MCIGGQLYNAAPNDMKKFLNITAPGIRLAAKAENKLYEKTMPDAGKQMMDKFMPSSVRQGILDSKDKGAKATLYKPNSEAEEAQGALDAEEQRQVVARAFAAKYNNQPRLLS
jgi:hypothetical protein